MTKNEELRDAGWPDGCRKASERRLKHVAGNRRGCLGFVARGVVCLARIAKSPRILS